MTSWVPVRSHWADAEPDMQGPVLAAVYKHRAELTSCRLVVPAGRGVDSRPRMGLPVAQLLPLWDTCRASHGTCQGCGAQLLAFSGQSHPSKLFGACLGCGQPHEQRIGTLPHAVNASRPTNPHVGPRTPLVRHLLSLEGYGLLTELEAVRLTNILQANHCRIQRVELLAVLRRLVAEARP